MSTAAKSVPAKIQVATVTSKGQVTIPVEIRRLLGAKTGDKLAFEPTQDGIRIVRQGEENVFEKFRGTGGFELPPGYEGMEGVVRYVREMRGHDEYDDLQYDAEPSPPSTQMC